MNMDLLEVIINSGVTLLVGAGGAVAGYKASINGAKLQIKEERDKLQKDSEDQKKTYKEAMEKFIGSEIKANFLLLNPGGIEWMKDRLKADKPTQYGFNQPVGGYNFKEYDNLKYELIKVGGEEVKDIIDIYEMFSLIERRKDMKNFTQEEYDHFKKSYNLCLDKYYKE